MDDVRYAQMLKDADAPFDLCMYIGVVELFNFNAKRVCVPATK